MDYINIVTNISKIVVEAGHVTIGNTKMKLEDFQFIELKKLDDKNSKFTFAMTVRKRKIQRDLYLANKHTEALAEAMKKIKPAKGDAANKKK